MQQCVAREQRYQIVEPVMRSLADPLQKRHTGLGFFLDND